MFYLHLKPLYVRGFIVAILLGLSLFSDIYAQTHTFRLYPDPDVTSSTNRAYFVYEAATAGTVMADGVLVMNSGSEPIHLSLYPADAMTASNGGVAIGTQFGEAPRATGTWLQLSESEFTLAPGEERSIPFTITIPDGMSPGEYAAMIVTQEAESSEAEDQGDTFGIRFIPQAATTVLMTIPGPEPLQPQLEITQLQATTNNGRQVLLAELRNTGNRSLENSEGTLSIREMTGALVQEIPVRLGYFLAGDSLTYRASLDLALDVGEYDVTLSLTDQDKSVEQTRRLSLAAPEEVPVVQVTPEAQSPTASPEPQLAESWPSWLIMAAAGGGVLILFLMIFIVRLQLKLRRQAGS
jgi:hypothetical protein